MNIKTLVVAVLLSSAAVVGGANAADDDTANSAKGETGLSKSLPLGPFKFTAGIDGSRIGTGLDGTYDKNYKLSRGCTKELFKADTNCSNTMIDLVATVDASWKSGSDAKNHALLTFQPTFNYDLFHQSKVTVTTMEADPNHPECYSSTGMGFLTDYCLSGISGGDSYGIINLGVYPNLQYREGSVEQGGKTYEANQLIYGGAIRLTYPALRSKLFATWPSVSVGYDSVHEFGGNKAPVPTTVKDHFLVLEGQLELYIPGTKQLLHANSNSTVLVKINGDHQPGVSGWEVSRTYQLIVDIGEKFSPAVTYKSGKDRGFDYDKQLLVGVAYALFDRYGSYSK